MLLLLLQTRAADEKPERAETTSPDVPRAFSTHRNLTPRVGKASSSRRPCTHTTRPAGQPGQARMMMMRLVFVIVFYATHHHQNCTQLHKTVPEPCSGRCKNLSIEVSQNRGNTLEVGGCCYYWQCPALQPRVVKGVKMVL